MLCLMAEYSEKIISASVKQKEKKTLDVLKAARKSKPLDY